MAEQKAARARRQPTAQASHQGPGPKSKAQQDDPSPRATAPGDRLADAQRQHVDGMNEISASLQEDLGGI